MKQFFALPALLSCVLAVPALALTTSTPQAAETDDSAVGNPTVSIGGSITIENDTGCTIIVTVSIAGVAGEPFVMAAGASKKIKVPKDPALIGHKLTVTAVKLMADDNGYVIDETYEIVP